MKPDEELRLTLSQTVINYENVKAIIREGANPNTTSTWGENYLQIVLRNNWSVSHIIQAIELGIDVNKRDNKGQLPLSLYLSRQSINYDVVAAFIKAGANPHTKSSTGQNYLHIAIRNRWPSVEIIRARELGINVNQTNAENFTAAQLYRSLNGADPAVINALNPNPVSKATKARAPKSTDFYQWSVAQKDAGALICDLLVLNDVPKDKLVFLGKSKQAKERVLQYITELPLPMQKALVDKALDDKSQLGQFFAVRRGWWWTSKSRGTLAKLMALQIDLNNQCIEAGTIAVQLTPIFKPVPVKPRDAAVEQSPHTGNYPLLAGIPIAWFPSAPPFDETNTASGSALNSSNAFRYYPSLFSEPPTTEQTKLSQDLKGSPLSSSYQQN
jgi:hypothetical protein